MEIKRRQTCAWPNETNARMKH